VDAGDLLFKKFITPMPESESKMASEKAHLIVEAFSLMGYSAVGIGDDDLTLGKDFLLDLSKKSGFPFLSANLFSEDTGKPLFQPYLLKEVNGLRVGIFSLISPEFLGPADPRRKGLSVQPPAETAGAIIKELQPKTDLIILLSHLGYPKDVDLAQTVPGIHIIVGSHTGVHLSNPPVIKNTILLQTPPKGMYTGRLDVSLVNSEAAFYNVTTRQSLERNLNNIKNRIAAGNAPEAEKAQLGTTKDGFERQLLQLRARNEFSNSLLPITEQMKDDPEIGKRVETYKAKFPEPVKHAPMK
jgi:2',3'-cyclic-nucleotide 2'-phosphodiesterase (5'-nucleotidase family)